VANWVLTRAPVRVLDAGGWTDTWFGAGGTVCNLAVEPGTEVSVRRCYSGDSRSAGTVELHVASFGDRYRFGLDEALPGQHLLLESTLRRWAPLDCALEVSVTSSVPPGSGMGTSASVVVGLIMALEGLSDLTPDPTTLARAAHEIETVSLGGQSGVQDQIAAANGGASLIEIDTYPDAEVRSLEVPPATWDALGRRTVTVYLGSSHDSSALHETVISHLETADAQVLLAPLRDAAVRAADALVTGTLEDYGAAMIANTEAQAALHEALVGDRARELIKIAQKSGAVGWKVNGAGGEGGSVTILTSEDPAELVNAVRATEELILLPAHPAPKGVRIVDRD
jgi:D-glycero-alpha-D-manno-heptose-7-phosphate kinase